MIVDGYEDPALEGQNIIFSCPSELVMIGPNSATCMGNGEWEPDPREVACTGGSIVIILCYIKLCVHPYSQVFNIAC